jgi:hypothetical protein
MKTNTMTTVKKRWINFIPFEIINENVNTEIGVDLFDFLYSNNEFEDIVENHIDLYIDTEYRRLHPDSIYIKLNGYDFSCEIESLEEELNRELTDDEREWFECEFRYLVRENVYY